MKKILFVLLIAPLISGCEKELSATEYLITYQQEVTQLNELFEESRLHIEKGEIDEAEKVRSALFKESNQALNKIERLKAYENADFFKKETLEAIRFFKDISSSEHRELIQILRKEKLELIDDVRVSRINLNADQLVQKQIYRWNQARLQFERMFKVSIS